MLCLSVKKYQPLPQGWPLIGDRLYLWGGWSKAIPMQATCMLKKIFNFCMGNWDQIPTSGLPLLGTAYYACAYVGDDLYYFGGIYYYSYNLHACQVSCVSTVHTVIILMYVGINSMFYYICGKF